MTNLQTALINQDQKMARLLLEYGADINQTDLRSSTCSLLVAL